MKKILLLLFFLIASQLFAQELKLAVGFSVPPYIIKETNSGFQIELIHKVLALKEHSIKSFIYASNKRMSLLLQKYDVDAAVNIPLDLPNIFYSEAITEFENVAISLKSRDIFIHSIFDLHYKRVLGFQNAYRLMGEVFEEYAYHNPLYDETIHQSSQVKNLVKRRIDVVIADKHIFNYYYEKIYGHLKSPIAFNYFKIFKSLPRYIGFTNPKIRDEFNEALKIFKNSKEYILLLKKYKFTDE